MDAERQRISEVLNVHGSLWRALVELKHDQHDLVVLDLPSIRERLQRERSAVNDYLAHEATLVRAPEQRERLQQLKPLFEKWSATWDAGAGQSELARSAPRAERDRFRADRGAARRSSIGASASCGTTRIAC